ncbi:MAG: lysine transporter LysE [Bacteroidetes bacterium]|nr:MAG: lysine transporter LysE [Bacteroidota bacterium]
MPSFIIKGLGLGFLLSVAVGPIIFTILKVSLRMGHRAGYAFVIGVSASDVFLAVLGNVAAELMSQLMTHRNTIALIGAALLLVMGLYALIWGKDPAPNQQEEAVLLNHSKWVLAKYTLQGFIMNTVNPGPIFFWLTACTSMAYLPLRERVITFTLALGLVLLADVGKVTLAGRIGRLLTPKTLHVIHVLSALILIGFGLAIGIGLLLNQNT